MHELKNLVNDNTVVIIKIQNAIDIHAYEWTNNVKPLYPYSTFSEFGYNS